MRHVAVATVKRQNDDTAFKRMLEDAVRAIATTRFRPDPTVRPKHPDKLAIFHTRPSLGGERWQERQRNILGARR